MVDAGPAAGTGEGSSLAPRLIGAAVLVVLAAGVAVAVAVRWAIATG